MPSAHFELQATATSPEFLATNCVRTTNLHPLDVQNFFPILQGASQNIYPEETISQPYATSSFPLDPALNRHTVFVDGLQHGIHVLSSSMSSPPSLSHFTVMPPPFQGGGAVHLLSHPYFPGGDPSDDSRRTQRTHSEHGPAFAASYPSDQPLVYQYQLPTVDRRSPPVAWSASELVLRSPQLARQRSAKACKKCRKRKTKVCRPLCLIASTRLITHSALVTNHVRVVSPEVSNASTMRSRL
jgi:hypothetical protein